MGSFIKLCLLLALCTLCSAASVGPANSDNGETDEATVETDSLNLYDIIQQRGAAGPPPKKQEIKAEAKEEVPVERKIVDQQLPSTKWVPMWDNFEQRLVWMRAPVPNSRSSSGSCKPCICPTIGGGSVEPEEVEDEPDFDFDPSIKYNYPQRSRRSTDEHSHGGSGMSYNYNTPTYMPYGGSNTYNTPSYMPYGGSSQSYGGSGYSHTTPSYNSYDDEFWHGGFIENEELAAINAGYRYKNQLRKRLMAYGPPLHLGHFYESTPRPFHHEENLSPYAIAHPQLYPYIF